MAKFIVNGVLLSEGTLPGEVRGEVSVRLNRSNALPSRIKELLSDEVKVRGGNALQNLKIWTRASYQLESTSSETIKQYLLDGFRWDDQSLIGTGVAILIDPSQMKEAMES